MSLPGSILLPADVIERRVGTLSKTSGSVAAVAAWCAIHAFQADVIIKSLCSLLSAPNTDRDVRVAVIYVIHELTVTCVSRGSTDDSAKGMMHAIYNSLNPALRRAVELESSKPNPAEFFRLLTEVLERWAETKTFPQAWVNGLLSIVVGTTGGSQKTAVDGDAVPPVGVPRELLQLTRLYVRYRSAKGALDDLEARGGASASDVESAKAEAIRRLIPLMKAVGCGDDPETEGDAKATRSLSGELLADMALLRGDSQPETVDALAGFF